MIPLSTPLTPDEMTTEPIETLARAVREDASLISTAVLSHDRVHRYALFRRWSWEHPRIFVVIGLNPSTADEVQDDPTIRRCIAFAKREGCGAFLMLNLFSVRATDPRAMFAHPTPSTSANDVALDVLARGDDVVAVAAWGVHGHHLDRGRVVARRFLHLRCFGTTKDGHPRHPLYLRTDTPLVPLPHPFAPPR